MEEGIQILFKASAFSPILFNRLFKGRDFLREITALKTRSDEMQADEDGAVELSLDDYIFFADLAYLFAYQGVSPGTSHTTPEQKEWLKQWPDPYEWLDQFGTFSIYTILPEIIDLWYSQDMTKAVAKKNHPAPPVK